MDKKSKTLATIAYKTESGQENSFDLDIVYAVPSQTTAIASPLDNHESIQVVTIENIVADKLAAAHRYRGGNSRMKDLDDLWRISSATQEQINWWSLKGILNTQSIPGSLECSWINSQMERFWLAHKKRNPGLPVELKTLMRDINDWLKEGLSNVENG